MKVICLLLLFTILPTTIVHAKTIGQEFLGETIFYNMDFLFLDKVAVSVIKLQRGEKPGEYVAVFSGKTNGIVGWLTSHKEKIYISHLEEIDGGKKFRPKCFEKRNISGNKRYREIHNFDYDKKQWQITHYNENGLVLKESRPLPASTEFYDILSAFYNFRYGVYGEISKGREYLIPAFSAEKGLTQYSIKALTSAQQKKNKYQNSCPKEDILISVRLEKEVFDNEEGMVWVWLTPKLVPRKGIAADAIGYGDVCGYLDKINTGTADPALDQRLP